MRKERTMKLILILGFCVSIFLASASVASAANVYGKLKWESGKDAPGQTLKIMFDSHDSQTVRSDSSGNFTVYWSGGDLSSETVMIFFDGDRVFKGLVKHGDSITVYIKP